MFCDWPSDRQDAPAGTENPRGGAVGLLEKEHGSVFNFNKFFSRSGLVDAGRRRKRSHALVLMKKHARVSLAVIGGGEVVARWRRRR